MKLEEDKLWRGPELMSVFGPLADKLHITVDKLKKLLHSPFLTNQAITRPVLSGTSTSLSPPASVASSPACPPAASTSPTVVATSSPPPATATATSSPPSAAAPPGSDAPSPAPRIGLDDSSSAMSVVDQTKEVLLSLKQAQEEAEELHPKGHRTICISRCLSTLFMYLSGDLPEDEAIRKIEEATKEIEQFWVNERFRPRLFLFISSSHTSAHRVGGKFEVQQFASIVNFLRHGRRDFNLDNPFSIFLEREEFQLYR